MIGHGVTLARGAVLGHLGSLPDVAAGASAPGSHLFIGEGVPVVAAFFLFLVNRIVKLLLRLFDKHREVLAFERLHFAFPLFIMFLSDGTVKDELGFVIETVRPSLPCALELGEPLEAHVLRIGVFGGRTTAGKLTS